MIGRMNESSNYVDPRTVQGPKSHVSNVRVVYDGGESGSSVAELEWDGKPSIGIRWNGWNGGNNERQPLGNPQSRGHPTWFHVPEEFADAVLARARELAPETPLEAGYREMAADTEREQEAMEWVNALMGDVANAAG